MNDSQNSSGDQPEKRKSPQRPRKSSRPGSSEGQKPDQERYVRRGFRKSGRSGRADSSERGVRVRDSGSSEGAGARTTGQGGGFRREDRPDRGGSSRGSSKTGRSGRWKDSSPSGSAPSGRRGQGRGARRSDSEHGDSSGLRRRPKRPARGYKNARGRSASSGLPDRVPQREYLEEEIRLNKYIAHAGFCSRRDADDYIAAGKVNVNGKKVTELGVKVRPGDKVTVEGQHISLEPFIYILLNKDKDTISTTDDEKDRKTVLDVVENATGHRVYPVGRLDRNTMGLLLLTNDGDLAHRLMHPSYKVKKTYEVTADRVLGEDEISSLKEGITLEDGPVKPSSVKMDPLDPRVITITIHEGRNHLVRRMIGHLGAEVIKLKRIRYGGLNDKDLRVGRWRYLKNKEVNHLRKLVKLEPLDFNQDED